MSISTSSPGPSVTESSVGHGSMDLLTIGVVVAAPDGSAVFVNRAWAEMTGQRPDDWRGLGWFDVVQRSDRDATLAAFLSASESGATFSTCWSVWRVDLVRRVFQVTAVPDLVDDIVRGLVVTFVDVTEEHASTERLCLQATHDQMTGLYNRPQFLEFVRHAMERQRRDRHRLAAVLFVDVDGLKAVNDRCGHAAGDDLLRAAAAHIAASIRPADVAARYGGDEFAVVCDDLGDPDEADLIAARIRTIALDGAGNNGALSLSVGVGLADDPDLEPAAVVARADRAMYLSRSVVHDRAHETGPTPGHRMGMSSVRGPESVLAAAAHELLSPMTTIAAFASMLHRDRDRMSPEAVETAFSAMERQSAGLIPILDDLLELGHRHSRATPAGDAVLLDECISYALEAAPPPDGRTVTVRSDSSSLRVLADRRGLARAVVNLLNNAYRHGGANIAVSSEDRLGQVLLSVEDDGPGVPDELVATVFLPFTRGVRTQRVGGDGTGLGLALAKETVEAMGGALEYRPVQLQGARFVITLPTAPA